MAKVKHESESKIIDTSSNKRLALFKVAFVPFSQVLHVLMRFQQSELSSKENSRVVSAWQAFKEIRNEPPGKAPDQLVYPSWLKGLLKALFKGPVADAYVYPPKIKNVLDMLKKQPVTPFLRGTIPGSVKEFVKNGSYKGPLILGAPPLAKRMIPVKLADYTHPLVKHVIISFTAGSIAGLADAVIGGPIDRYATFRATSQKQHAEASFYKELMASGSLLGASEYLYQGLGATTAKGFLAFSTYFLVKDPAKAFISNYYPVNSWEFGLVTATTVGFAVALTSAPLDIIKTGLQMPGAKKDTIVGALKKNFKTHGMAGVMTGVPLKFTMATMGWGITFFATQKVEEKLPESMKVMSPNISGNSE